MKRLRNIKQICTECGNELIIKDFDLFMRKLRDSWALASSKFKFEELPEDIKKHIREQNKEEYILKSLEKGYVKFCCNPCSAILFYEAIAEGEKS